MTEYRATQYPHHLARLVAVRLRAEQGQSPPETVLTALLETLYCTSLRADDGRRILCTLDYLDPAETHGMGLADDVADQWSIARFDRPMPLDVRTLGKLGARQTRRCRRWRSTATASGIFTFGEWSIRSRVTRTRWRWTSARGSRARGFSRPASSGRETSRCIAAARFVASLVQNAIVEEYHNVLWTGPVHAVLRENLLECVPPRGPWRGICQEKSRAEEQPPTLDDQARQEQITHELVLRWINSVCRILLHLQRHHHGGGLLILGPPAREGLRVNYALEYDRLGRAVFGLVESHLRRNGATNAERLTAYQTELEAHKSELLSAIRFIAALARVEGVVLLDQGLKVLGFGAELRAECPLDDVYLASDARGSVSGLRRVELSRYGTRHRAMMRLLLSLSKFAGVRGLPRRRNSSDASQRGPARAVGEHRRAAGFPRRGAGVVGSGQRASLRPGTLGD